MDGDGKKGFSQALPWGIAGVAVLALVVTLVSGRGGESGEREALAKLNERLDALERSPAREQRRPAAPALPAGLARMAAEGADAGALGEPLSAEEMAAERDRQLRELEAQFERDAADPAGGPRAENALVQTISSPDLAGTGLRPRNVDIACKQSTCRTVGSFDRMGDAQDWGLFYITAAGDGLVSRSRMVFVPKPDGTTELRVYSERPGG